jgi:hypothetical protein
MLFVVRAETAVIRASMVGFCAKFLRNLARLDEFPASFVVVDVPSNSHTFRAVLWTSLQHPDFAVKKDNFGVSSLKTRRAYALCKIVVRIRSVHRPKYASVEYLLLKKWTYLPR